MLLERLRDFSSAIQPEFVNDMPLDFPPNNLLLPNLQLPPGPMAAFAQLQNEIELNIQNYVDFTLNSMEVPPTALVGAGAFNMGVYMNYADALHAPSTSTEHFDDDSTTTEEMTEGDGETSMSNISEGGASDDYILFSDDDITEISEDEEPTDLLCKNELSESVGNNESSGSMSIYVPLENISTDVPSKNISTDVPSKNISTDVPSESMSSVKSSENMNTSIPFESMSTNVPSENTSSDMPTGSMSTDVPSEDVSSNESSENTNSNEPSVIVCNGPSENACAGYVLDPLQIVVYLG